MKNLFRLISTTPLGLVVFLITIYIASLSAVFFLNSDTGYTLQNNDKYSYHKKKHIQNLSDIDPTTGKILQSSGNKNLAFIPAPLESSRKPAVEGIVTSSALMTEDLDKTVLAIIEKYIAKGFFVGPKGEKGEKGDAGERGLTGPAGTGGGVSIVPPNPVNNFFGATLFSATDLSSTNFITSNATVNNNLTVTNNLTVNGSISGDLTLSSASSAGLLKNDVSGVITSLAYGDNGECLTIALGVPDWGVCGGASGADADATYIVQTATDAPTNAQVLGSLTTGLLKNTTTTGVLSVATAGTDYVIPSVSSLSSLATVGTITSGTWQGAAVADTYIANDLTISGGTINNSAIGSVTPSTGAFTSGSFSGALAADGGITNNDLTFTINAGGTVNIQDSLAVDGDLTISGDDLFMGTNTSGFILVADGTNYNPVAMSGDITLASNGATTIGADKVLESHLKAVDSATDEECLSYESTTGDFEWQTCGGSSSLSGLTAAATTNSINNVAYQQNWSWDSLAGGTGLVLSASTTAAASDTQKLLSLSLSGANATSTQTTYAEYITNTHTGTSSTNVGLYASASGGTNNYAAIFESGSVGIGDTTPDATLHVVTASAITKGIIVKGSPLGSGIEPDDISGLVVWLKADSLSLNNNDPVTSWTNSSGSGNDATQGTGASQPLYIASGTNGKPVVRFDGTDDFLAMDSTVTNSRTLLMVIRHVDGSSPTGESPIGESTAFDYFGEAGTDLINSLGGTNADIASGQGYTNGAYTAVLNIQKPANIYSIITIVGTANSSFNWIGDTYHYLGASQYWEGDIAEIIAYDSALSIANKEAVEKYLSDKYNISVTASSGGQTVNLQEWQNSSGTALASVNEAGRMLIAPDPSGSGSPNLLSITGPAHINLDASVEAADVKFGLDRTVTFSTGALTTQRAILMNAPSYAFVAASTITNAATLGISGAPVKSTNASITNTHGLLISAGAVSTATNSFGLTVNAQTGATNNYAAQFMGGNVGIGDASPSALLSVGNGDLFKVTSAGAISSVVGITSSSNYVQSAGTFSLTSANTNQVTTASAAAFNVNSLTTGTGIYAASSTLTSGKLFDLQVSGTAAAASQTALNILTTGANGTAGITTYGAQISNTHSTNTSTNVALYLNASGGATANYGLIVNAGNVGIGTTTPSYPLHVVLGSAGVVARFTDTDGSCDIDPTSTALVCSSDQRLKKDVATIESALEKVLQFRGVNFKWNSQADDALRIGFIAQEVENIVPELVKTDFQTGYKSVNYTGFVPIIVNAIKEQQNTIDSLQVSVDNLQGSLSGNIDAPIVLKGHLYLTSDSVGQAKILSGSTAVRISFDRAYEYQPIVTISPRGEEALNSNFRYSVIEEDELGFTIKISSSQNDDIEFSWHAFASEEAKLTVSDGSMQDIVLIVPEVAGANYVNPENDLLNGDSTIIDNIIKEDVVEDTIGQETIDSSNGDSSDLSQEEVVEPIVSLEVIPLSEN